MASSVSRSVLAKCLILGSGFVITEYDLLLSYCFFHFIYMPDGFKFSKSGQFSSGNIYFDNKMINSMDTMVQCAKRQNSGIQIGTIYWPTALETEWKISIRIFFFCSVLFFLLKENIEINIPFPFD